MLDRHVSPGAEDELPFPARIEPPTAARPQPPHEFAIKCPVCDTLVYVTEKEIGQRRTCPDCFSTIDITPPRPKPRRVNEVDDADYADDEPFELSAPAELDLYRPSGRDGPTRTVGEQALRNAERELAERERDETGLPGAPLWTGVFQFPRESGCHHSTCHRRRPGRHCVVDGIVRRGAGASARAPWHSSPAWRYRSCLCC